MPIGNNIDRLIRLNVEIWHQAIKIKSDGKPKRDMPTKDRVKTFLKIRRLNAERSSTRWSIDENFDGPNETKLNYAKGDKC